MIGVGLDLHQRYLTAWALDDGGVVVAEQRRLCAHRGVSAVQPPEICFSAWAARRCWPSLLVLVTACRSGFQPDASVTRDSAGVSIVENRAVDYPLADSFARAATISEAIGSPVQLSQLTEYTVDADTVGHIYVNNEWFGARVQLFDTAGRLVRALTRHGGGPGEIGQGVSISVSGDGVLAVTDFTKTGVVRVRADGSVLPLLSLTGYYLFGGARVVADTVVLHTMDPDHVGSERLRYRTDHDTATLMVHTPRRLGPLQFCRAQMTGLTPMLAPDLRWTARGSLVLVHGGSGYRIDQFHAARLVRSIRRDVPGLPGSVESVRRFFPDGKIIGSQECVVSPAELVRKRGVADWVQPIRRLALDRDGRIWAERNTFPDQPPRTDVFDPMGRYLGTLIGFGAPLGFPSQDLFLFALPDSVSDGPTLGIFRRVR